MVQQIIPETTKKFIQVSRISVTLTDSHVRSELFDDLVNRGPRN